VAGVGAGTVVDIPTLMVNQQDFMVPCYEVCNPGESFNMGLRNGTAAPITPQLFVVYADEPAS